VEKIFQLALENHFTTGIKINSISINNLHYADDAMILRISRRYNLS
jgi:hypothetical protein